MRIYDIFTPHQMARKLYCKRCFSSFCQSLPNFIQGGMVMNPYIIGLFHTLTQDPMQNEVYNIPRFGVNRANIEGNRAIQNLEILK